MRVPGAKRAHKYGARGVRTEDGFFPSQRELRRWEELKLLQMAGEITDLERQVAMPCVVNDIKVARPVIDFRYRKVGGEEVYEDVKGYIKSSDPVTRIWKLQHKLLKALYNIEVEIVK